MRNAVGHQSAKYISEAGDDPTPTTQDTELDEILAEYGAEEGEFTHALKQALLQWAERKYGEREAVKIGLFYNDGSPINIGDTVDVPYITPVGDLTEDIDDDKRAVVVFEHGLYGLKYPFHVTPLRDFCLKVRGEYVSNYGEPVIFSSSTILIKAQLTPTTTPNDDERED